MALLPNNEIESELSYAYLHAVAAKAGMGCEVSGRHSDNLGIDATITAHDTFGPDAILTDVSLHIQLKATTITPALQDNKLSYFLHGLDRYEKLRRTTVSPPRILVFYFCQKKRTNGSHGVLKNSSCNNVHGGKVFEELQQVLTSRVLLCIFQNFKPLALMD